MNQKEVMEIPVVSLKNLHLEEEVKAQIPVVSVKNLYSEEELKPPSCRCEFVHKWLDDHVKYFPPLPPHPTPRVITRLCAYTYGPAEIHYYYSQPVNVVLPPRNIQLPYIIPAPHRISPLRPTYH